MTPPDPVPPTAFTAEQLREMALEAHAMQHVKLADGFTYAATLRTQLEASAVTIAARDQRIRMLEKMLDEVGQ